MNTMRELRENKLNIENKLHDLGASLRQFQGPEGFHHLLEQGKLSILSALGEFSKSNDEIYNTRMKTVSQTRVSLIKLSEGFENVGKTIETLLTQVDDLFLNLQKFHEICEEHLELNNSSFSSSVEETGLNTFQSISNNMHNLSDDLNSNIKLSCCGIQASSLQQLEKTYMDVKCIVNRTQTEFDAQRRKIQVYESDLTKAQVRSNSDDLRIIGSKLQDSLNTLQIRSDQYRNVLQQGMDRTSFALEQASMGTWTASNIFFLQLSSFFKDIVIKFEQLGSICSTVKNNREVSKRINCEKRAAAAAALAATSNANFNSTVESNQIPEPEENIVVSSSFEHVDMFSGQSHENSPSVSKFHEDSKNQRVTDSVNIDDLFK